MVFGEHDQASLPLFQAASRGILATPTLRRGRLSMVYVGDLADALIAAADKGERISPDGQTDPGTGVYFVAYQQQPTFRELGGMLGEAVGRSVRVVRTPSLVTKAVGAAAGAVARLRDRPSILNADKTREATAGSWICSVKKATEKLGWKPREPVETRLRQTAESYGLRR
jgi:nucleoside-diphosphate-sugar epimerase